MLAFGKGLASVSKSEIRNPKSETRNPVFVERLRSSGKYQEGHLDACGSMLCPK